MSRKKSLKPALVDKKAFKDQLRQTPAVERQLVFKKVFETAGYMLPGYSQKRAHLAPLPLVLQQMERSPAFEAALQGAYYSWVKKDVSDAAVARAKAAVTEQKAADCKGQAAVQEEEDQETTMDEKNLREKIEALRQQLEALQQEFQSYKRQSKEEKQEFRIQLDNEKSEKRNLEKQLKRAETEKAAMEAEIEKTNAVHAKKLQAAADRVKAVEAEKQELQKKLERLKKYEEKQLREKSKLPKILIFSRMDISEETEDLNCDLCSNLTELDKLPWREYAEIWNVNGTLRYSDKLKLKPYTSLKVLAIDDLKKTVEEKKQK